MLLYLSLTRSKQSFCILGAPGCAFSQSALHQIAIGQQCKQQTSHQYIRGALGDLSFSKHKQRTGRSVAVVAVELEARRQPDAQLQSRTALHTTQPSRPGRACPGRWTSIPEEGIHDNPRVCCNVSYSEPATRALVLKKNVHHRHVDGSP